MLIKCYVKLLTSRLSMAALASVEYRCSIYVGCYLQQTVHFFQSDPHAVIPNKLANNASDAFLQLISDKPSHTPDSKN